MGASRAITRVSALTTSSCLFILSGKRPRQGAAMSDELTPDNIMQLGFGFWSSKTLLSAVDLGVFSEPAEKALDLETLRQRLSLHPRSARDFFDALVALRMLDRNGALYSNTPETDFFLDRAKPSHIGGILEMANARLYHFWGSLTEGLRTGQPQNEVKTGGDFFGVLYQEPARLKQFIHPRRLCRPLHRATRRRRADRLQREGE